MSSLISLRADILNGDLRAVYLGWLRGLQAEGLVRGDEADDLDEEDEIEGLAEDDLEGEDLDSTEPPVPPGLGTLTGPLESLVAFLGLDQDLVAVAAEASAPLTVSGPAVNDLKGWIGQLPAAEKDDLLLRMMRGEQQIQALLLRRFREETASPAPASSSKRRTVRELLEAATARTVERKRREAEVAAQERARKQKEAAEARTAYLKSLIGSEGTLWRQAELFIDTKRPNDYDRAVKLLVDLRDLADREGKNAAFGKRLGDLRERHAGKSSLMKRLDGARLR